MVYIKDVTSALDVVHGYTIEEVSPGIIEQVREDFEVGAFHRCSPMALLKIHETTHLHGLRPRDAAHKLRQTENWEEPAGLIFIDKQTGRNRSIIWVGTLHDLAQDESDGDGDDDGAASTSAEDNPDSTIDVPNSTTNASERATAPTDTGKNITDLSTTSDEPGKKAGNEIVDVKQKEIVVPPIPYGRFYTVEAPSLCVNFSIGNMSLWELLDDVPAPVDENAIASQEPIFICEDYSTETPLPVYVVAYPGEWEESREEENCSNFFPRPSSVVRLKPEIAEPLDLLSDWTVGWEPSDGEYPSGTMAFAQQWDCKRRPVRQGWTTPVPVHNHKKRRSNSDDSTVM